MKNYIPLTRSVFVIPLIIFAGLAGCSGAPLPSEKMAVAEAAIQRANTRSTSENAPGELQIAIGKLAMAKQALANDNLDLAAELFEQASIDAQVAELRAEAVRSQNFAQETQNASKVLSTEIDRN